VSFRAGGRRLCVDAKKQVVSSVFLLDCWCILIAGKKRLSLSKMRRCVI
jgi:hypothetical protein